MRAAKVVFLPLLAIFALASARARAADPAAAEALFAEAKRLSAEGKHAQACPKYAESNQLDRAPGTLLLLADCYERTQRLATAWATFKEGAALARDTNKLDWQKRAQQRVDALAPRLPHVVVRVNAVGGGLEVVRDGSPMSSASFGVPIPVDMGRHVVRATAPGRKPFETTVDITREAERVELEVPELAAADPLPAPRPAAPAVTDTPPPGSSHGGARTLGWITLGVGGAGLAVGGVTGVLAMRANDESRADCPLDGPCASAKARDANARASDLATVSTIAFIAGGVLTAAGAVLVLTSRSHSHVAVSPFGLTGAF